ncbi:TPA: glycosyltransferase family 2 protein, partial [Vibrio metschnikovii]
MEKITIGVLSYKRIDDLLLLLEDLYKLNKPVKLIVVNNDVTNDIYDTISHIKSNKQIELQHIAPDSNLGVAGGRNLILDNAIGKFTIFFDDDLYIPNINEILDVCFDLFKDENVSGIAFNVKDYNTKGYSRFEIPHSNKNIDMSSSFYTYLMIGAGHAVRNDFIKKHGGYPDDFGLYGMEEIDLSFKIISKKSFIIYDPRLVVEHKKSPDGRLPNSSVLKNLFVNKSRIARKYLPFKYFITTML